MNNTRNPGQGELAVAAFADQVRAVEAAIADLVELRPAAAAAIDRTGVHADEVLLRGAPERKLGSLADRYSAWADELHELSNRVDRPRAVAAQMMRDHIELVRADLDRHRGGEVTYEDSMRGGLGGVHGDFAASFNLSTASAVAELLDAIQDADEAGLIPTPVQQAADRLISLYRDARSRDDDFNSRRL